MNSFQKCVVVYLNGFVLKKTIGKKGGFSMETSSGIVGLSFFKSRFSAVEWGHNEI